MYANFRRNHSGFSEPQWVETRNLPFPITLAIGFYNSLYYRASRDNLATRSSATAQGPRDVLC